MQDAVFVCRATIRIWRQALYTSTTTATVLHALQVALPCLSGWAWAAWSNLVVGFRGHFVLSWFPFFCDKCSLLIPDSSRSQLKHCALLLLLRSAKAYVKAKVSMEAKVLFVHVQWLFFSFAFILTSTCYSPYVTQTLTLWMPLRTREVWAVHRTSIEKCSKQIQKHNHK